MITTKLMSLSAIKQLRSLSTRRLAGIMVGNRAACTSGREGILLPDGIRRIGVLADISGQFQRGLSRPSAATLLR